MTLTLEQPLQKIFPDHDNVVMARSSSWNEFLKYGLPTKEQEAWKYTDLTAIYQKYQINCVKVEAKSRNDHSLTNLDLSDEAYHFVFIDGALVYADQHPSILLAKTLPTFEPHRHIKYSTMLLAEATAIAGLHLRIKEHVILDKPIHIHYVHSDACDHKVVNYQNIIELSPASKCQVYEHFISTSDQYSAINLNTKIHLAENTHYCYDFLSNQQQRKLVLTNTVMATLAKGAQFETFQLSMNTALTRFDFIIDLVAREAKFHANGICTIADSSHSDYHFYINHLASDTASKVDFRAIASGKSTVVFNAKGYVAQNVKNIQVLQNNRNIQLTDGAKINTKSELEIYADDVVCNHAATVGTLDQKALFYLQTRGIAYEKAVQLLLEGFVKAMITELPRSSQIVTNYLAILQQALLSLDSQST